MKESRKQLKKHFINVFPKRFLKQLGDKTIDDFCRDTGISKSSVSAWLNKRSCPRLPAFVALCAYFNCKTDYFLEH